MTKKAKNGKTIVQNVIDILRAFPEARDNDRILMSYYWAAIDEVEFDGNFKDYINSFKFATPPSSIQRARQMINYEAESENFLPNDPAVLKRRKEMQAVMTEKHGRMNRLGSVY